MSAFYLSYLLNLSIAYNFQVDLGSLQDTVPTDRIVVLQGGWGLFRKRSSGEILLRLTYKAYVEDEEDDKTEADSVDVDVSDDELSDSDQSNVTYEKGERDSSNETDKESFMDVLAALIVSEEFQGIVASETGNNKLLDNVSTIGSTIPQPRGLKAEPIPSNSTGDSEGSRGGVFIQTILGGKYLQFTVSDWFLCCALMIIKKLCIAGSALFWLAVITCISVLIAINIGGSSFFNP